MIVKSVDDAAHAEFSNVIADALDDGQIPWRIHHLPQDIQRGTVYAGINPLLLQVAARRWGFSSPYWSTLAGWHSQGCKVLQRPPATHVVGADPLAQEAVFNFDQTDRSFSPPDLTCSDVAEVLDNIISRAGVKVHYHFHSECVYRRAEDCIRMPDKFMFILGPGGETGFFDALAHELMHWSEPRVGWQSSDDVCELRAEIGSGYLLGTLGVRPLPLHLARHHRRFAPAWSLLLRCQPSLLFRVCESVISTLNWLLSLVGKHIAWETGAQSPAVVTSSATS